MLVLAFGSINFLTFKKLVNTFFTLLTFTSHTNMVISQYNNWQLHWIQLFVNMTIYLHDLG